MIGDTPRRITKLVWVVCCFCYAIVGCQTAEQASSALLPEYFDLKGLLETNIEYLEREKPEVEKSLTLNGLGEVIKTRELDWRDELAFFLEADLNKPALKGSYDISTPDSISEQYTQKEGLETPVKSMTIRNNSQHGVVREVIIFTNTQNKLFDSERTLTLHFEDIKGGIRLVSYSVKGSKKLALGDPDEFEVVAVVKW